MDAVTAIMRLFQKLPLLVALLLVAGCGARAVTIVSVGEVPRDALGNPILADIRPVPMLVTDTPPASAMPPVPAAAPLAAGQRTRCKQFRRCA